MRYILGGSYNEESLINQKFNFKKLFLIFDALRFKSLKILYLISALKQKLNNIFLRG